MRGFGEGISVIDGNQNQKVGPTVDGRKNPAPVDMVDIPLFTRFSTSQVLQDFFHQLYLY